MHQPAKIDQESSPSLTLFALPYAGGNAFAYRPLERYLGRAIRLSGIELPGRGRRTAQPLLMSLPEMAADVFAQIRREIAPPYALFGHSMGATIAYLIARRIRSEGLPPPLRLFAAGREAPSVPETRRRHSMPRGAFLEVLAELGGCPAEVLRDPELMEFFEPILRADFRAVETYRHEPDRPLDLPITVLIGDEDEVNLEDAARWQEETTCPLDLHRIPGNHFFLFENAEHVGSLVTTTLTRMLYEYPRR